jgi:hypothetical protein
MRTLAHTATSNRAACWGKHEEGVLHHSRTIEQPILLTLTHVARLLGEDVDAAPDLHAHIPSSLYDLFTVVEAYWASANDAVEAVLPDLKDSGPPPAPPPRGADDNHTPGQEDGEAAIKATAIIAIIGQMHQLCQDTSNFAWEAARIAEHDQPHRA